MAERYTEASEAHGEAFSKQRQPLTTEENAAIDALSESLKPETKSKLKGVQAILNEKG